MSSKSSMTLAALLAGVALCLPAAAEPQEGMVVVRDANTGKFRAPTAAELRTLQAQQPRSLLQRGAAESLVTIRPNGTLHKHLGENALVYSVVHRDPQGKLAMQCVNGEDAASAALGRPAPATGQEHDHETR
ncbi:MAG TPA: hypothetical protein VFS02_15410 [Telluria sp.]|nr:hypothetical protein [Telluria sp.]